MNNKPKVGISQCLLGDAVRYDGKAKPNPVVLEKLSQLFEFVAVCPEVEAGLPVPRPPVQLSGNIISPRLTGRDDPDIDVTDVMQNYCMQKPGSLIALCGFIFKSRSPSCGLNSTPVFVGNKIVDEQGRGIFANALCKEIPLLPVIEDTQLESEDARLDFIDAVNQYQQQLNL